MTILSNLKTDDSIQEDKDVLGGGYRPLESGLYDLTIESAYVGTSQGGAVSLNIVAKTEDQQTVRQTLWMTSGKAKGCKNYYEDANGTRKYLPGFTSANNLCLLTVGKEIGDLEPEEKVINLYDYDAKKELPTKVQMIVELVGQEITAGVVKQTVDKNVKDGNGNYVPSGETRDENEISKFFRKRDGMTVAEIKAEAAEAVFKTQWAEKNTGVTINKAKGLSGAAGVPQQANTSAPKPAKSLFS